MPLAIAPAPSLLNPMNLRANEDQKYRTLHRRRLMLHWPQILAKVYILLHGPTCLPSGGARAPSQAAFQGGYLYGLKGRAMFLVRVMSSSRARRTATFSTSSERFRIFISDIRPEVDREGPVLPPFAFDRINICSLPRRWVCSRLSRRRRRNNSSVDEELWAIPPDLSRARRQEFVPSYEAYGGSHLRYIIRWLGQRMEELSKEHPFPDRNKTLYYFQVQRHGFTTPKRLFTEGFCFELCGRRTGCGVG